MNEANVRKWYYSMKGDQTRIIKAKFKHSSVIIKELKTIVDAASLFFFTILLNFWTHADRWRRNCYRLVQETSGKVLQWGDRQVCLPISKMLGYQWELCWKTVWNNAPWKRIVLMIFLGHYSLDAARMTSHEIMKNALRPKNPSRFSITRAPKMAADDRYLIRRNPAPVPEFQTFRAA